MEKTFLRATFHHEWILTNKIGGYALSLGNLLNERKYNGLLVAGLEGFRRIHVLASIEEAVQWRGSGFFLDANHYPDCIHPHGYEHIVKSWLRPNPSVLYSSHPMNKEILILKEIFLVQKVNAVVVKYKNMGKYPLKFIIRPKFTLRDHHHVNHPGLWDSLAPKLDLDGASFRLERPGLTLPAHGMIEFGQVSDHWLVYRNVFYPYEAARGYEAVEDLWAPVKIEFQLEPGQTNRLVVSLGEMKKPFNLAAVEEYYQKRPLPVDHPERAGQKSLSLTSLKRDDEIFTLGQYLDILTFSAEDFLVDDDIIAGYPWFGPWSRDTLIAMGGLKHLKGGRRLALRILHKYGHFIKNGLLPNMFSEGGQKLSYNSVDAPLWYVLRSWEFGPKNKELLHRCAEIVLNYLYNHSLPFLVDEDGLIEIRRGKEALTWMDAVVYDQAVTPRWGKPIEINALWYNALRCLHAMALAQGKKGKDVIVAGRLKTTCDYLEQTGRRTKESLLKFVGPDYLADRLTEEGPVFEIRPNAIIALSLPFDWLDEETMGRVYKKATEKLLTPKGLRSLSPDHPAFKKKYLGNQKQRDLAYHQGTVWAWLLGPLARVAHKLHTGRKDWRALHNELSGFVWRFRSAYLKNHIASVAEIWDGLNPQLPKGCPAQAWSVMAVVEIEHLLKDLEERP